MTRDFEALRGYAGSACRIFSASRSLEPGEAAQLEERLRAFLQGWASHGAPVDGAGMVAGNRFVIVSHRPAEIAGCAGDALLFFLREEGARLGVDWVGGARVFYRDAEDRVADADRPSFRKLAAEGVVAPDTIVFDTTLRETDALLAGRFALPARDSWHARLMA